MTLQVKPRFIAPEMTTDEELASGLSLKEDKSNKNQPSGYAGLDAVGKILSSQLPTIYETSEVIDGGTPSTVYLSESIDGGAP
jgi:hypothetical protein